ncbi:MAG: hypothetical protein ACREOG_05445 [Gemmatimonadaceae bacterium]
MRRAVVVVLVPALACSPPAPAALPPNAFAFGVFGDGPYRSWEIGRFKRLMEDVNGASVQWLLHVGDLLWYPCSDAAIAGRREMLNAIRAPVIYTPGDNEWADCHADVAGRFEPLDRLRYIRRTFFSQPRQSLGTRPLRLESQSDSAAWAEFVENARWRFGGFLFVTIHIVGSANAGERHVFSTAAQADEVERRTEAALQWLDVAFELAQAESLRGVVVAMHGDPGIDTVHNAWPAYRGLVEHLAARASTFAGVVLLIHGDGHDFRVDHPLTQSGTRDVLSNFTRLETFGSPDIGWVRVVIDTLAGRIVSYEPRVMPRWVMW